MNIGGGGWDCQVKGTVDEYWRGEGGNVRFMEPWMGIRDGREGLSSVVNYGWVLDREVVSE